MSLPSSNSKRRAPRPDRRPIGECATEGCDGPKRLQARGLCAKHYHRLQRTGDPLGLRRTVRPDGCAVDGCDQTNYCRDWCVTHYSRWIATGTTEEPATHRCEAPDCNTQSRDQYCWPHKNRLRKYGRLHALPHDRHVHSRGYIVIKLDGHPLAQARKPGWLYEHRAVLLDKIGPSEHPCHWCGTTVSWERIYPKHADGLVVDHLDDSRDNNSPDNLVPSCAVCNLARGQKRRAAA